MYHNHYKVVIVTCTVYRRVNMGIKDRIALQMRMRKMKNPTGLCELPTGYRVSVAWGIIVGWGFVLLSILVLVAFILFKIFYGVSLWWVVVPIFLGFFGAAILAKTIEMINNYG